MKRLLLFAVAFILLCPWASVCDAQSQTVPAGSATTPVIFPAGCVYDWVNDNPAIGLPASGHGDIPSFIATDPTNSPYIGVILATPETAGKAYITNQNDNTVSVIDILSKAVIATIPVGKVPVGVAVSQDNTKVYVSDFGSNDVSVIDAATNQVTATIPIGNNPSGIAVSPDGTRVYALNIENNLAKGTVSVINTATNLVIATVTVQQQPTGVVVSPDNKRVYVTNFRSNTVSVINAATNTLVANITGLGTSPDNIAFNPDGSALYVTNINSANVSIIDAPSSHVVATVPVGQGPSGIAISPDGRSGYVSNVISKSVTVFSTLTYKATGTYTAVNDGPASVSLSADGKLLYVENSLSNDVSVIDVTSTADRAVANIQVGRGPQAYGNFTTHGGCQPIEFTIKVNPVHPPTVFSPLSGYITACEGIASSSPNIEQFTYSATNLPADVNVFVIGYFEVSLSPNSGFSKSFTLPAPGGIVNPTTIYIRAGNQEPPGNQTSYVDFRSGIWDSDIFFPAFITPSPTVNAVASQVVTDGGPPTAAINFTGTTGDFNWVNDTPGIGLPASGTGNIPSFNAINKTADPITARVTVVPIANGYGYVTNSESNTLSVFNVETNTPSGTITVGKNPGAIAVTLDYTKAYVTNSGDNTMSVIDVRKNLVTATIPVGNNPRGVAIRGDGRLIYVSNFNDNTVSMIRSDGSLYEIFQTGRGPYGVLASPDQHRVYVSNQLDNTVTVFDLNLNRVIATITVGAKPEGLFITANNNILYVVNSGSNSVSVINTQTFAVDATIPVGNAPTYAAFGVSPSNLYVTNTGGNSVSVIDMGAKAVIKTIPVAGGPVGVSFNNDATEVYVTLSRSNKMAVINTATNTIIKEIDVGATPTSFGSFVAHNGGCSGASRTFTITVNPSESAHLISATAATGTITACAGTPSSNPNIQQFTVSGTGLPGNIVASPSNVFEISLSPNSSYTNNLIIPAAGGKVNKVVVYVRSAASAPAGIKSDFVSLSSGGGLTQNVAVTATIIALPAVDAITDQVYTTGQTTTVINFTGGANAYNWINDTPAIGLAASGGGSISPFVAINNGTLPIKATIKVTPSSPELAYIANQGSNNVSVINIETRAIIATIPVGSLPRGVSVSPDGSTAYVSNLGDNNVSVINTATNKVSATIQVGKAPYGLAVSPDGKTAYVANFTDNTVSIIKTAIVEVDKTVAVGKGPYGVAVSPDNSRVYVSNQTDNTVSVLNAASGAVVATVNVGTKPQGISISPDGKFVYVVNNGSGNISVISTSNSTVAATINVDPFPAYATLNPDGSKLYVASSASESITVIDTKTNTVASTMPANDPVGLSFNTDGTELYVINGQQNTVAVINVAANTIVSTIGVGNNPASFGNFITHGTGCTGVPKSFTITVNPEDQPLITVSGALTAFTTTYGTLSPPQSFTVSGTKLKAGILVSPPAGFEVSADGSTFSGTVTVGTSGTLASTPVYIRLTATTPVGGYGGDIMLSTAGADKVNETIPASNVTPAPLTIVTNNITKPFGTTLTGGTGFTNFTATGLQNEETIGSVTITYGIGSAAGDPRGAYGGSVILSDATGGTFTASNYSITYATADISVLQPVIAIAGVLSPLNTIYGTPSASESFTISGSELTAGVLVSPPAGFEVSADGTTFSNTVTIGTSGLLAETPVFIRLAAITPVGSYSDNIVLTSPGAGDVGEMVPISTVAPAPLTITADNKTRLVNTENPALTATYQGFVNNETIAVLTTPPVITTTAVTASPAGQYPIMASGALAVNYNIAYIDGVLTVTPALSAITIPNTFTPNGDGINDTWNIANLDAYQNCSVMVFNRDGQNIFSSIGYSKPWSGDYKGSLLPPGTYYYVINLKNNSSLLSGFVAIIR